MQIIQPSVYLLFFLLLFIAHFVLLYFSLKKLFNTANINTMEKWLIFLLVLLVPIAGSVIFLKSKAYNRITLLCFALLALLASCTVNNGASNADTDPNLRYLTHQYKYIDGNNRITADSITFQQACRQQLRHASSIASHRDSLSVVLPMEFANKAQADSALYVLSYSWTRLAYHLWMSEDSVKALAGKTGADHPYQLKSMLSADQLPTPEYEPLLKELRTKVFGFTKDSSVFQLSNKKLLDLALLKNQSRVKDEFNIKSKIFAANKSGGESNDEEDEVPAKGCGRKNCCMLAEE